MISSQPSHMVYLKSILAGLAAVVGVVLMGVLSLVGWAWWMTQRVAQPEGPGAVAYEVNSAWIIFPAPIIAGAVFAIGFWWEFRRAKRA